MSLRNGIFSREEIRRHIRQPKTIDSVKFRRASKSRDMPRFLKLRGERIHHTDVLNAGGPYRLLFLWRDGAGFTRRKFMVWLFLEKTDDLVPVARMDYHPSHKGFHVHLNCEERRDFTNRAMPGARDLALKGTRPLDPSLELDRTNLVGVAMRCFNIEFRQNNEGLF